MNTFTWTIPHYAISVITKTWNTNINGIYKRNKYIINRRGTPQLFTAASLVTGNRLNIQILNQ